MKKIAVALSACFFASSAFAFPTVKKFGGKHKTQPVNEPLPCPDFTGMWKGGCSSNGDSPTPDAVDISQVSCTEIYINNDLHSIPGTKIETNTGTKDTVTSNVTLSWSNGTKDLNFTYSGSRVEFATGEQTSEFSKGSFRMDGEKLYVRSTLEQLTSGQKTPGKTNRISELCTYTKD